MRGIVSLLKQSHVFSEIKVIEFVDEDTIQLLKIRATVKDGSVLYITELQAASNQKYSYHWQKEDGEMLLRWDSSPHYKNLKTFPHHVHESGKIKPSHRITVEEVIREIRRRVEKR